MVNFECEKLLVRESVISKNLVLSSCILYSGWLCDPNKLFSVEQNKKKMCVIKANGQKYITKIQYYFDRKEETR